MDHAKILILVVAVMIIFYFDARFRRIPNAITFTIIGLGLITNLISHGFAGLLTSILGFIVGIALLFIPFTKGGVGAGDVKMLAGIGALLGYQFVITTFLYGAIVGGVFSIIVLIRKSILLSSIMIPLKKLVAGSDWGFPYGIPLGIGALAVLFFGIPF